MRRFTTILAATTVLLAVCGISGMASAEERSAVPVSFVPEETARPRLSMSEIPSARPAQTQHAQLMGSICRWEMYYCWLPFPMPVGTACSCPGFWGTVSPY